MKNTFGNNISLTLFGESHGVAIGCVIDGLAPGIKVDMEMIYEALAKRRGILGLSTERREADEIEILSGVKDLVTEGTPIALLIRNSDTASSDYKAIENTPRPSHADLGAEYKYHGFQDKRGGGHFSGRITAPIVAAGAIIKGALLNKGIKIGTHIKKLYTATDRELENYSEDIELLENKDFPTLSDSAANEMKEIIARAKEDGDSVGGILETVILGLPEGIGEPWFDTLEGVISHAVFSVPAVKGIEFGAGFAVASMTGSEANDPYYANNGKIFTEKNSNGGICGGISLGMPIIFRTAIKPTPSISKEQKTVEMTTNTNTTISIKGRHDPAIIARAGAVIDAVSAIAVADMLVTHLGTDYLRGDKA